MAQGARRRVLKNEVAMILTEEKTFTMPVTVIDARDSSGLCKNDMMMEFTNLELLHAVLTCTMPSGRLTPPFREKRKSELVQKMAMIENALEVRGDQLVKSQRTMYLDVSEKGVISHCLGTVFAKILAGKMFQDDYLVSVNQIEQQWLEKIGCYEKKYRYDLIGLQKGAGTFSVWEAVGRSENSQLAFRNACKDAETVELAGSGEPLHRIACMTYYEKGFYTAVVRENSKREQMEEGPCFRFDRGDYLKAYYQPLMELLLAEHPEIMYAKTEHFCSAEISLPFLNEERTGTRRMYVGMGAQLLRCLRSEKYGEADGWKNTEIPNRSRWYEGRDGICVRAEG